MNERTNRSDGRTYEENCNRPERRTDRRMLPSGWMDGRIDERRNCGRKDELTDEATDRRTDRRKAKP